MIFFMCLALSARVKNRSALSGIALGCAVLTKFYPLLLVPALYRQRDWKFLLSGGLTVIVFYAAYGAGVGTRVFGFLGTYAKEEQLGSGGRYYLLVLMNHILRWLRQPLQIPPAFFVGGVLLLLCALAVNAYQQIGQQDQINQNRVMLRQGFLLVSAFSVLLSFDYPWYFAWLAPFLVFVPSASALFVTLSCFVLYRSIYEYNPQHLFMLHSQIWLPFLLLGAFSWWIKRQSPKPGQIA
jgi:hypothetical protein